MAKAVQTQLPGVEKPAEEPLSVRDRKMLAKYVKPQYLDCSFGKQVWLQMAPVQGGLLK